MHIELTEGEIRSLLESLEYSKQRIRDAPDTPYEVRRENLARLDELSGKLSDAQK